MKTYVLKKVQFVTIYLGRMSVVNQMIVHHRQLSRLVSLVKYVLEQDSIVVVIQPL